MTCISQLIFLVVTFLRCSAASLLSNSASAEKAVAYLWSQVDSESFKWPEGEISSAILGLVSAKPPTVGGRFSNATQQLIVNLNMEAMATDFLQRILKPAEKSKKVGSLDNIDIPSLIQWIGVLMVNCQNPRNYFGYDLVAEAVRRLDDVPGAAPTYGALIMTVCNADSEEILKRQHFQTLVKSVPSIGHRCPFCVERSAFNVLALACLVGKASNPSEDAETHLPSVKSLRGLIGRFTKYIDSVQEADGSFGTAFATSLAVQAKLSTKVKSEFDVEAAWKSIKNAQKPDGSFGSSITASAIILPALTGQTAIDIKRITCPNATLDGPNIIVAYELEDQVFSQQKFRGRLIVPKKTTLLKALQDYAKENPSIFKLETETVGIGTRISSVNGVKNDEAATTHWFMDAIYRDGRVVPITTSIGTTLVEPSTVVIYRLSFKTAKLGL